MKRKQLVIQFEFFIRDQLKRKQIITKVILNTKEEIETGNPKN